MSFEILFVCLWNFVAPGGGSLRPDGGLCGCAQNATGARFESGRGADGIVYAIGLLYRCSGDGNSSLARGEQQDTLSATALPYERPVNLPTVWETAEAGRWDCVGTRSSWLKARRSTSSGKMLWRDCEGVLSYQQNAAWSIFTRALRSLPASGRGNTANEEG